MKRCESDIAIPNLGTLVDVEIFARHAVLFGVTTGNSHAIGFIENQQIALEDGSVRPLETLDEAVYRVFGATLKEVG